MNDPYIESLKNEIKDLKEESHLYYRAGFIDGLSQMAWWKDGEQYVGTSGTRLKDVVRTVESLPCFSPRKDEK